MDQKLIQQIKEAEAKGWKLCTGCSLMKSDDADWSPCQTCPIETRRQMGYREDRGKED